MPAYPWLIEQPLDLSTTQAKMNALRIVGVPYSNEEIERANDDLMAQAQLIADDLAANQINVRPDSEVIALIAYLQRLGTDIRVDAAESQTGTE